jgi:hypothetical protein
VRPDAVPGIDAHALRPEVDRLSQHLGGKHAVLDDLLLVVKIVNEQVERLHPLLQARFGAIPFVLGDDARHDVERPGAVDAAAFGVDGEGDAHHQNGEFGGGLALVQFLIAQGGQVFAQARAAGRGPGSGVLLPVNGHQVVP